MHLYKTSKGNILRAKGISYFINETWDNILSHENLYQYLVGLLNAENQISEDQADYIINNHLLAPIGSQEVWAAGVTYLKSRDARMEESEDTGAADCYQRVYEAERPELFFKSLPHRVAGHKQYVHIRKDSTWDVPEPELTLVVSSSGKIIGYTIGNDMSSRSIEGENPLYLPQAKSYDACASVGPCIYVTEESLNNHTTIRMEISRNNKTVFEGSVAISQMKRTPEELVSFVYRECSFPYGCLIMTGTGIVPEHDFTLKTGDEIKISIEGIGVLANEVM